MVPLERKNVENNFWQNYFENFYHSFSLSKALRKHNEYSAMVFISTLRVTGTDRSLLIFTEN